MSTNEPSAAGTIAPERARRPAEPLLPRLRRLLSRLGQPLTEHQLIAVKRWVQRQYVRPASMYCWVKGQLITPERPSAEIDMIKRVFRQTQEEFQRNQRIARSRVEARNDNITTFAYDYILDVIGRCSSSLDFRDWFIALELSSGLRQCEILKPECKILPGVSSDLITVEGIAKKRGEVVVVVKKLYGIQNSLFMVLLTNIRARPEKYTSLNAPLSRLTRHYFPLECDGQFGTHINRTIYAAMCAFDANNNKKSAIRAAQLGLNHESMSTATHYLHVRVSLEGSRGPRCVVQQPDGNCCVFPVFPRRRECPEQVLAEFSSVLKMQERMGIQLSDSDLNRLGFGLNFISRHKRDFVNQRVIAEDDSDGQ